MILQCIATTNISHFINTKAKYKKVYDCYLEFYVNSESGLTFLDLYEDRCVIYCYTQILFLSVHTLYGKIYERKYDNMVCCTNK